MIGFYDYTVILTFLSLVSSVFGMTQAMGGHFPMAVGCLAVSGLCDAFDGKVARTKKNRTEDEAMFGIQLDSLCDVICFGVFPALLCYKLGVHGYIGGLAISYYCICSVVRLSYFNVLEVKRQNSENPGEKVFHGLPITSSSVIVPVVFLLRFVLPEPAFVAVLTLLLFVVGTCFVLDFRMKKPSTPVLVLLIVIGAAAVVLFVFFSRQQMFAEGKHTLLTRLSETLRGRA